MEASKSYPAAECWEKGQSPPGTPNTAASSGWESRGNGSTTSRAGGSETSLSSSNSSTSSSPMPALLGNKRVPLRVIGDELKCPDVAWPTVALFLVALCGFVVPAVLTFRNPGLSTLPLMAVCNYILFTPMHDAAHRAVSRKYRWLNELVGYACGCAFLAPFAGFRFLHLEHHKHTNDENKDPDTWSSGTGNPWTAVVYWATQPYFYYVFYVQRIMQRPVLEAMEVVGCGVCYIIFVALSLFNGYHSQIWYLLILPKTLAEIFLSYSFDYAPHRPHDVLRRKPVGQVLRALDLRGDLWSRAEDIYKCTSMMAGMLSPDDGLDLSIPLLYQNLHNVHHLYPTIPFYRYCVVWARHKNTLLKLGTPLTSWLGSYPGKQAHDDLKARRKRQQRQRDIKEMAEFMRR